MVRRQIIIWSPSQSLRIKLYSTKKVSSDTIRMEHSRIHAVNRKKKTESLKKIHSGIIYNVEYFTDKISKFSHFSRRILADYTLQTRPSRHFFYFSFVFFFVSDASIALTSSYFSSPFYFSIALTTFHTQPKKVFNYSYKRKTANTSFPLFI